MRKDSESVGRSESLATLAAALESMLKGGSTWSADSMARWRTALHPDGADVMANVDHFIADSDIRATDPEYRAFQDSQMRELIGALRRAAPREELLSFSFLG
jgi:hypothetical protein